MAHNTVNHPVWSKALKTSADPPRTRHHLELLAATGAAPLLKNTSPEQSRILCALFSGSQTMSGWLIAHPAELATLTPEQLDHPRRKQGLRREVDTWLAPLLQAGDYTAAYAQLRHFKQREMLRIATRDLARLASLTEIIQELSDVADVCLNTVAQLCWQQLTSRLGQPRQQDAQGRWQPATFCIFGLGKLGGQELNYSSDVDVIFVYSDEGQVFKTPLGKGKTASSTSNHQFFNRLAEMFIGEVGRMTGEGMLYRIDLRLRPEGDAGPLARSLASYENYYAQWGQTWERMMLIKARCVAGDETLGAEFLEMIQPFRYPRSLGEGVLREVAAMKYRIESEVVKAGELERNVKLGRGGIREIEFVAQTLQLINAGRLPFLQGAQTLPALEKLLQYELLSRAEVQAFAEAYVFLRDVEHRLQMEDNLQTHSIPVARPARERLAALMGFRTLEKFESALKRHTDAVRRVYDRLLKADSAEAVSELPSQFEGAEDEWKKILAAHGFKQVDHSVRLLNEFINGPGYVHVSKRTSELAEKLLAKFFVLCPGHCAGQSSSPSPPSPMEERAGERRRSLLKLATSFTSSPKPTNPGSSPSPPSGERAGVRGRAASSKRAGEKTREAPYKPPTSHVISVQTRPDGSPSLPTQLEERAGERRRSLLKPSTSFSPPDAPPTRRVTFSQAQTNDSPSPGGEGRGEGARSTEISPLRFKARGEEVWATPVLSDPDRVLTRLDSFITAYGTRSLLFETWHSNPRLFELLLLLFDRSEFLAELAIHTPDLVDELVTSGRLRQRKTAEEILRDLRHGARDADQHLWLRRYHQAELMRIALRDILGLADFEQNLTELSALADACLQYALEIILRRNKIKGAPLVIIGLGKLGGSEINYGSDLDLIFVTNLPSFKLPKIQRIAVEVMDLLSTRTEQGIVFPTDARLRPDGDKSLLVNTLDAYENYYCRRAQLWEIQSLSRARPIAGNPELGKAFHIIASNLTNFSRANMAQNFSSRQKSKNAETCLAAYTPDWKKQIHRMRMRIEKERTPPGKDALAIKTGAGGLMDAEFIAQTFCLAHGWHEPNTLRALMGMRDNGALERIFSTLIIDNYRQLRRVEGILRRWSFEGETVLPEEEAPFHRVAVRCGFGTSEEFRLALKKYRAAIREVYNKVFCE